MTAEAVVFGACLSVLSLLLVWYAVRRRGLWSTGVVVAASAALTVPLDEDLVAELEAGDEALSAQVNHAIRSECGVEPSCSARGDRSARGSDDYSRL